MDASLPSVMEMLAPEVRLLLGTVRDADAPAVDPGTDGARVEWPKLKALMIRERATSVAWPRLPPGVREAAPREVARDFGRVAAVEQFRQIQLMQKLEEALEHLPGEVEPPVLLKGAALALTCYADPVERPMFDLDVLLDERAARAWHRRLREEGWFWDEERYPEEVYERHFHLPPLEDARGTGGELELHTGLFLSGHPFALDASRLRTLSRETEVAGRTVLVPRPAAHLVYVCLHFAWSHVLSKGGWRTFRDVAALTGTPEFRWPDFLELARGSRSAPFCYWTLRLAARLGRVPVPGAVLDVLRPPLPDTVLAVLERHFALQLFPLEDFCPSVRLERVLWRLGTRTRDGRNGIRPWAHMSDFASTSKAPLAAVRKLIEHVGHVPGWIGYLTKTLGLAPDAAARRGERAGSHVLAGGQHK